MNAMNMKVVYITSGTEIEEAMSGIFITSSPFAAFREME